MLSQKQVTSLVSQLSGQLNNYSPYHKKMRSIYRGEYQKKSLGISLTKQLDAKLQVRLDWGRTIVDVLHSRLPFDAFQNDTQGATRLLYECGGYQVVSSAMRNSMISSCSFVATLPGNVAAGQPPILYVPYAGDEATGIYNSTTGSLDAGLAIYKYSAPEVVAEYLLFMPGEIYRTDAAGKVLSYMQFTISSVLLSKFVFQGDPTTRPSGESRFTNGFMSAYDQYLLWLKRVTLASEHQRLRDKLLFMAGSPDAYEIEQLSTAIGEINAIYRSDGQPVDAKTEDLSGGQFTDLIAEGQIYQQLAASAASMSPSSLGYAPSNGSFSAETIDAQNEPFSDLIASSKISYGNSIKEVAHLGMSLLLGTTNNDTTRLQPVWLEKFDISNIGAMGDALQKIAGVLPEGTIPQSFIQQKLGIPLRESLINVEYPNFTASQALAAEAAGMLNSEDLVSPDGTVLLSKNIVPGIVGS